MAQQRENRVDEKIRRGEDGEQAMAEWLDKVGLGYLYVAQSPERFAGLFGDDVKRPDFLVLLDSLGLIAVDVKNYTANKGEYTLKFEKEVKKVVAFERIFRIPVWYAYLSKEDKQTWHWISALKAVEVGEMRSRRDNGEKFLSIKMKEFVEIRGNTDLGKLYTQRIPGLKRTKKI
jgi:hypothetical protein